MDYLQTPQQVIQVDESDIVIQPVDKWVAHQEGILHRAFTLMLFHKDNLVLQHRYHPVFNNVMDASISSHQLWIDGSAENDILALNSTLERETNLTPGDLMQEYESLGSIYYKAPDPNSVYIEHEVCHVYKAMTQKSIEFNAKFSFGKKEISPKELHETCPLEIPLAPWVQEMIAKKMV